MLKSKVAQKLARNFLKGDMPITGAVKFSCQPWFSLMQDIVDKWAMGQWSVSQYHRTISRHSVQCNPEKLREEVSVVNEQGHCWECTNGGLILRV
jgi:hypothetical protein